MTLHPHRYIRTIDTVADAVQFTGADSATAIVLWITDLVRDQPTASARYDSVRNAIALPPATRPGYVEVGWWVVRWPSGEFGAYSPAAFASMFDRPAYLGYLSAIGVDARYDLPEGRDVGRPMGACRWPAGCAQASPAGGLPLEPAPGG